MALTISSPPVATNLCTLQGVLAEGMEADDTQYPFIARLIAQASDAIVRECHRPFAKATFVETLPGYGDPRLMLLRTPIVSVTTVVHNSTPIIDFVIEDADAGFLYRKLGWDWTAGIGWAISDYIIPRSESPDFTVTYIAGYVVPGVSGQAQTLPGDVEKACIETVKVWFTTRARDPSLAETLTSSTGGMNRRRYFERPSLSGFENLPPRALALLRPWIRAV